MLEQCCVYALVICLFNVTNITTVTVFNLLFSCVIDFCFASPAELDVVLALNLHLLITELITVFFIFVTHLLLL